LQREIKNKTIRYGIAALLLACVLTATVYNFGIQTIIPSDPNVPPDPNVPSDSNPQDSNVPSQPNTPTQPNTPSTPNLPSPSIPNLPNQPTTPAVFSELKTFSSYDELETFINVNTEKAGTVNYFATRTSDTAAFGGADAAQEDYSTTNIQVAGVDEADVVKSDGEYLYVVSAPYIYILKAYPADQAEVVSKIEFNETYGVQIYVNENKLAVLANLTS